MLQSGKQAIPRDFVHKLLKAEIHSWFGHTSSFLQQFVINEYPYASPTYRFDAIIVWLSLSLTNRLLFSLQPFGNMHFRSENYFNTLLPWN